MREEELEAFLKAVEDTFYNGYWIGAPLHQWALDRRKARELAADIRTAS